MGLSIEVGSLAYLIEEGDHEGADYLREQVQHINAAMDLLEDEIAKHQEPENLPQAELNGRANCISFPYSFLHYLRRLYILVQTEQTIKPADDEDVYAGIDETLIDELSEESHLLGHSDAEGFYLPNDFDFPFMNFDEPDSIAGAIVGSSVGLQQELVTLAEALDISLDDTKLSDKEVAKLHAEIEAESDFYIEKLVWLALFEASRLSIKHHTMIQFC